MSREGQEIAEMFSQIGTKLAPLYDLVYEHFKNKRKTDKWFETKNPLLGNARPLAMIQRGQAGKLEQFIRHALSENKP